MEPSNFDRAVTWLLLPSTIDDARRIAAINALAQTLGDDAPLFVLAARETGLSESSRGLIDKIAGAVVPSFVKEVTSKVLDGVTTVVRDQYRDDRAAQHQYDQRAKDYLDKHSWK